MNTPARLAFVSTVAMMIAPVASGGQSVNAPVAARKKSWTDRVTLRGSFDKERAARPATLSAVITAGDPAIVIADVGVRFGLGSADWEAGPFLEYHRNTSAKSPQNLLKAGLTGEKQLWDIGSFGHHRWSPIFLISANYKRDRVNNSGSRQAAISTTVVGRGCARQPRCALLPNVVTDFGWVATQFVPYLGIEYETSSSLPRSVTRAIAKAQTELYPFPERTGYRVQLTSDYSYRRGSVAESTLRIRDHRRFDAGLNLHLIRQAGGREPKRAAGVGVAYSNGSNPANGLERQESTRIALTIQL